MGYIKAESTRHPWGLGPSPPITSTLRIEEPSDSPFQEIEAKLDRISEQVETPGLETGFFITFHARARAALSRFGLVWFVLVG